MHPDNQWFKAQRPITSNAPEPRGLVYNEDRTIEFECPLEILDQAAAAWPEAQELKCFVYGRIEPHRDGASVFVIEGADGADAFDW